MIILPPATAQKATSLLGTDINFSKLRVAPKIPNCTSWKSDGKFESFIPSAFSVSVAKADSLAHLAISWSSHHTSLSQSCTLLLSDRQWETSTLGEMRILLQGVMDTGTQYLFKNALIRFHILQHLTSLKASHRNISEYQNLLNYRRIISHFSSKIDFIKLKVPDEDVQKTHPLVKKLTADIGTLFEHLKSRDTKVVFNMSDGSCAFAVPFGMSTHPITLLFILDSKDQYHLRIFNKGMQPERNPFLRNPQVFNLGNDTYAKNDILISNINSSFLSSPNFISDLIRERCTQSGSLDRAYRFIYEYTIHHGKGRVIESPEELAHEKAKAQIFDFPSIKKMKEKTEEARKTESHMVLHSPFFHPTMTIGACFEANVATPEEFIASPKVLADVKSYSLQVIADSLRPQIETDGHKLSLSLVEKRISIIRDGETASL